MQNNGNKHPQQEPQPHSKKTGKKDAKETLTLLQKTDRFFETRSRFFFWLSFVIALMFGFSLFDVKVSTGGDDAAYIQRAYDFIKEFIYPTFQGALYPIVISPLIAVFGIDLVVLKLFSFLCILAHQYLFYITFRKRIPASVLYPTLVLLSVNSYFLYYASQTYSEAFFVFIQISFFLFFFKYFGEKTESSGKGSSYYKPFIVTGLFLFLISLTKNVGFAAAGAVICYFALRLEWKRLFLSVSGFLAFFLSFEVIKRLVWGINSLQVSSQGTSLMRKDFYNPALGNENLLGLLRRTYENTQIYFSQHLFAFLGFRTELSNESLFLTILVVLILCTGLWFAWKKNKYLFFTGIYTVVMCFTSFFVLQTTWKQSRIIIIYYPFLLLLILYAFYSLLETERLKSLRLIYPILLLVMLFEPLTVTLKRSKIQGQVIQHNISGNMLYGYTPDWVNFIRMSKWAAKNVPDSVNIASRKPDISFIYGERKFAGIASVPQINWDSIRKRTDSTTIAVDFKYLVSGNRLSPVYLQVSPYSIAFVVLLSQNGEQGTKSTAMKAVFNFPKNGEQTKLLAKAGIPFEKGIRQIEASSSGNGTYCEIYDPDALLNGLRNKHVRYAIMASLRKNPYANTGNIINTIHRYLYYIELKYPGIISEVHKIGTSESATLVKINY